MGTSPTVLSVNSTARTSLVASSMTRWTYHESLDPNEYSRLLNENGFDALAFIAERIAPVPGIASGLAGELAAGQGIEIDLTMPDGKGGRKYITPHVLKHTAITWTVQRGAFLPDVASYFSTSLETIERVYWHHSPDHQRSAVEAMDRRK
ncbi:site-specific integrase [Rhodovulum sulfidophilum]|nr:hypothetical protein [Rhodovulum sulfidophilum]MCE8458564.1 hypothetical protein [Rhodovulum sulfidophilum]